MNNDFLMRGPPPAGLRSTPTPSRGRETEPDTDTPSPGGVRAGPEGGMPQ